MAMSDDSHIDWIIVTSLFDFASLSLPYTVYACISFLFLHLVRSPSPPSSIAYLLVTFSSHD